jgi:DNA-binding beta-propeller fold protein YncE
MKKLFAIAFAMLALMTFAPFSLAQSAPGYKVAKRWKLGGDGGWDYLTVDSDGRRLFIARSTRVMVVDEDSGKLLTEIPDTPRVHGIVLTPEFGRGFISDGGEDMVAIFDLKSLKVLKKVKVGTGPDAIVYDSFTKRVFVLNAQSKDSTVLDGEKGVVVGRIDLGGSPEVAVSDDKGTMFVNIADTSEIVTIDPQKLIVKSRWKLTGCEEPTGLALDRKTRRLFAGCGGNKKMAIVDADSGKIIALSEIGQGCDGVAFDPDQKLAFASAGDGTITVIREDSPDKFSIAETVTTQVSARTMALDVKSHELFTVAAEVMPGRKVLPDTFVLLAIKKTK